MYLVVEDVTCPLSFWHGVCLRVDVAAWWQDLLKVDCFFVNFLRGAGVGFNFNE